MRQGRFEHTDSMLAGAPISPCIDLSFGRSLGVPWNWWYHPMGQRPETLGLGEVGAPGGYDGVGDVTMS